MTKSPVLLKEKEQVTFLIDCHVNLVSTEGKGLSLPPSLNNYALELLRSLNFNLNSASHCNKETYDVESKLSNHSNIAM